MSTHGAQEGFKHPFTTVAGAKADHLGAWGSIEYALSGGEIGFIAVHAAFP